MWENYQNKKCLKFASGLQVKVIPNCFYCRMFLQYTGDAIVCIKVLKAPIFYMNHSRHYPCSVLQVTSPKVWDVQHPDIPHWTKGHEDLGMSNNIWLQDRIVPNRHIGTDSESSSRDDVKMDIVFVYAHYIHVYIHHIHIADATILEHIEFPTIILFLSVSFWGFFKVTFYLHVLFYMPQDLQVWTLTRDPNVHRTNLRWPERSPSQSKNSCNSLDFPIGHREFFPMESTSWASSHVCEIPSVSKELIQRSEGKEKSGRPARALQITDRVLTQIIEAGPWPTKVQQSTSNTQERWMKNEKWM